MARKRATDLSKTDMTMLVLIVLLVIFGLAVLFSSSEYNGRVRFGDSACYFKKQLFATALGMGVMYMVSSIDYHFFLRLGPVAYLISMFLSGAAHMEFEYIRHGTVSLIGFFDVATRRMEKPYLNSTRTEKDFVEAIRALIETDPEAPWTFVCDGLNIHKSESLVRFVAGQCGSSEDLGSKGRSGILKNQESRAEFLHHKDHRIRIVYTPKHCSWMNQMRKHHHQ